VHDGRERVLEIALFQRLTQRDLMNLGRFRRDQSFPHKSYAFNDFSSRFGVSPSHDEKRLNQIYSSRPMRLLPFPVQGEVSPSSIKMAQHVRCFSMASQACSAAVKVLNGEPMTFTADLF